VDNWLSTTTLPLILAVEAKDIVDNWNSAAYEIVDVRSLEHYTLEHIPNAINIPYKSIASPQSLATLSPAKQNLLYCYTGHSGQVSTTILNLLNYPATNIEFGMMGWNEDAFLATGLSLWDSAADYPVETETSTSAETYAVPSIPAGVDDPVTILQTLADTYLNVTLSSLKIVISSANVKALVDDWDNHQDGYQLVSVVNSTEYAVGHVPYAVNIPWQEIAKLESLQKFDPAKVIIVSGNKGGDEGQMVTTALNLLGYKARNMKFGMMDWNLATLRARGKQAWSSTSYPTTTR
jgi:rhodanese-related sulfurtransferase